MDRKRRFKKPELQREQWSTPQKRMRGQGIFYDEPKEPLKLALTPTAKTRLKELATLNKLSASEFLERWLRGVEDLILP